MTQPTMEPYSRHFVVNIEVQVVNHLRPVQSGRPVQGELGRQVLQIARIVVTDKELNGLVEKATKHLELVDINGVHDIDTSR